MNNVVQINYNTASADQFKDRLVELLKTRRVNCWDIAETVAHAKYALDDTVNWREWIEEDVSWDRATADRYVQVHTALEEHGRELVDSGGCSHKMLLELSRPSLARGARNKIIKQMLGEKPLSAGELKQAVSDALPAPKATIAKIAGDIDIPVFSVRLEKCVRDEMIGGGYLFALRDDCNAEDIKTVAKIYKQKYHPDKGGSTEEFDAICRAEEAFTASKTGGAK